MARPDFVLEVFLQPGEFHFGDASTQIRTLLGSCVAITLWHPQRRIGGMCHYLLPSRAGVRDTDALDGRYADEALEMFLHELDRTCTRPEEYEAKLFGGGRMFGQPETRGFGAAVPDRNVLSALGLMAWHGFRVKAQDLGGSGHRNVIFDVWSGDVWVRRNLLADPADLAAPKPRLRAKMQAGAGA